MWNVLALPLLITIAFVPFQCNASDGGTDSGLQNCTATTDCPDGEQCVSHFNYSVNGNCDRKQYCLDISQDNCMCLPGYTCRQKDCTYNPVECLILENEETRCGGPKGPQCDATSEVCGYQFLEVYCYQCPCYGSYNATCVPLRPDAVCGDDSIAVVQSDGVNYHCDGCGSAVTVLTGKS